MSAYDIGIVKTIQEHYPLNDLERGNAVSKLNKQHSMLETTAKWAVDQWVNAIDKAVIRELKAAQEAQEKERAEKLFGNNDDPFNGLELPNSHETSLSPAPVEFMTRRCLI